MHELKRAQFHVLFALSKRPLHGLAIADEVDALTDGQLLIGPGTLYRTLEELAGAGHIEEVKGPEEKRGRRRRFYQLTRSGLSVLRRDTARLEEIVLVAKERDLLTGGA